MKNKSPSNNEKERIIEEVQKLLEERGRKPLEMARKAILEEEIESKEVKEALHYFITEYWHDLARPTLMSICCEAVGGDPNATIPFAVPLSLISGALDIQDDIIDQSKTKHGRPTVYGKYGKEIAILTADALLFKGFTLLHEAYTQIPKEKAQKIMKIIKNMFYELGDAEALELNLRGRIDIKPKEYLRIIRKKAADVEAHAKIAAMLGNASEWKIKSLGFYGRLLGMLIIIRDDLEDTIVTRELKHRINKEHLPLPLIYSITEKDSSFFKRILEEKMVSKDKLEILKEKIEQNKGFERTFSLMMKISKAALSQIQFLSNKNYNQLYDLLQSLLYLTPWKKRVSPRPTNTIVS